MSDTTDSAAAVNAESENPNKPVWGAAAIGRVIARNKRTTYFLLEGGHIKCAQKKGGRWVASPAALLKEFGA